MHLISLAAVRASLPLYVHCSCSARLPLASEAVLATALQDLQRDLGPAPPSPKSMRALLRTNCFRPMNGLDRNFRVRMVGAAMVKLNSRLLWSLPLEQPSGLSRWSRIEKVTYQ